MDRLPTDPWDLERDDLMERVEAGLDEDQQDAQQAVAEQAAEEDDLLTLPTREELPDSGIAVGPVDSVPPTFTTAYKGGEQPIPAPKPKRKSTAKPLPPPRNRAQAIRQERFRQQQREAAQPQDFASELLGPEQPDEEKPALDVPPIVRGLGRAAVAGMAAAARNPAADAGDGSVKVLENILAVLEKIERKLDNIGKMA